MKKEINQINDKLSKSCQNASSSCCCKGQLFLPGEEFIEIDKWTKKVSSRESTEFLSRISKYSSFYLYDQRERCQFLDLNNLCRLHYDKVKPSECFWWPLHVYTDSKENLEIRVSTSCCDAYKYVTPACSLLNDIEESIKKWGTATIKKFRRVYKGSYNNKLLKKL